MRRLPTRLPESRAAGTRPAVRRPDDRHSRRCGCRQHRPETQPRGSVPCPAGYSENPSLGAGEKTPPDLLIDALDALLEGEHLRGKFCNYARGYLLCGQSNALGCGCAESAFLATLSDPLTERFLR